MKKHSSLVAFIMACLLLVSCNHDSTQQSDPPWVKVARFESFAELQEFISVVCYDPLSEGYAKFVSSRSEAEKVVDSIKSIPIPCVKKGIPIREFLAEYYVNPTTYPDIEWKQLFCITYVISGVKYHFTTTFMEIDDDIGGKKVLKNQSIETASFDLYKEQGSLVGNFKLGTTEYHVMVQAKKTEDVNFDHFKISTLLSEMGRSSEASP